jgi:pimeloyl-ACP methyl ester carboxylesterase
MLWTRYGGRPDGPILVMLHGLGATGEVWRGVEALLPEAWDGGWVTLDLPGHGRSPWGPAYTFDAHAAALAAVLPTDRDLVLLGHSMGGMVALELAASHPAVRGVVVFSVKTWGPPHHVEGMRGLAERPVKVFGTRQEALDRYAKVAGLAGLVAADDPALEPGIVAADGGWALAQDPATHDFGAPDIAAGVARCPAPVRLARGSEDPFVRAENLTDLVPDPVTLDGLGHNPHVERPSSVVGLL